MKILNFNNEMIDSISNLIFALIAFLITLPISSALSSYIWEAYQSTNPPLWGLLAVAFIIFAFSFRGLITLKEIILSYTQI